MKPAWSGLQKVGCHGNKNYSSSWCVTHTCRTISLPRFNGVCCKLTEIGLFVYFIYLVECMTSSVLSVAYFTHFSNLNISWTNADICKWVTGILNLSWNSVMNLKIQGVKSWLEYNFNIFFFIIGGKMFSILFLTLRWVMKTREDVYEVNKDHLA